MSRKQFLTQCFFFPFLGPETQVRGYPRWSWTQEKAQNVKYLYYWNLSAVSPATLSPSVCVCSAGCNKVLCKKNKTKKYLMDSSGCTRF